MVIERVDLHAYAGLFREGMPGVHLYTSAPFLSLMAPAADELRCYVMRDSRVRAGIALGLRDGEWRSPFSAPFGGFCYVKEQTIGLVDEAVGLLKDELPGAVITLPPDFYFPSPLAKERLALLRHGTLEYADINYHYPLADVEHFAEHLDRSARQKLHDAERAGFVTELCSVSRAYAVIRANREARGYPLAMPLEQVEATAPVAHTVAMVMSLDGEDVAAVIAQRVTAEVAQIVYWGDAPGYSHLRPMNLFPLHVFRHLHSLGYTVADIGPASQGGAPDLGLCVYKEGLGCMAALKPRFRL